MSTTYDPAEYEAISRLFDLVCEGNGDQFEMQSLDSQIATGLKQAYQPGESAAPTGA